MRKWHLIIDIEKCEDCNNCFLACKDEHMDNHWPGYAVAQPRHGQRWMNILRKERGRFPTIDVAYRPTPCMHCDNAPCIEAATGGAVTKREDGIVLIDPDKARGQKALAKSCPYGAIWWNEAENVPQKCTFCAHLLDDGWQQPRCVQACPTGALRVMRRSDEEMAAIVRAQSLEVLSPELNTRPRVYYKNLYRFNRCFIAGTLVLVKDGKEDCASNAKIVLKKNGQPLLETTSDVFGDFKFDKIEPDSGAYQLEIDYPGTAVKTIDVEMTDSISLEPIHLT